MSRFNGLLAADDRPPEIALDAAHDGADRLIAAQ
jgi:hypothetical protein